LTDPGRGRVDRSQVKHVLQHELDTAERLADLGELVTFIPAPGTVRVADVEKNGVRWELKSPISSSRNTIVTRLGRGAGQAAHIVFDLSRTITQDEAKETAQEVLRRYSGVAAIRLIGRETVGGPLDITIER
jgi:Contact-dependent growth inhibition CdiA C-terminal domain